MRALRLLRRALVIVVVLCLTELAVDAAWPYPTHLLEHVPASRVFVAADGSLLRAEPTPDGERCIPVPLSQVSPHVVAALISSEDRRFRAHSGVDPLAIARAAAGNVAAGHVTSGASTVTMQLARLVEPRPRSLLGKALEALRARQLERVLTKDEILAQYLNRVPFGGTTRGIEAAARRWLGKSARDLDLGEAAMLIAMLPAPTAMAPDLGGRERLRAARDRLLDDMLRDGAVSPDDAALARRARIPTHRRSWPYRAPHACDHYGARTTAVTVRTTIDLDLQMRVEEVTRAHRTAGADGVAVVVLDRSDGALRAMLGSRDYRTQPLNAATCRRSAGSTLKPFLYALAIDRGIIGPRTLVADTPLSFRDYAPGNFEGEYRGAMTAADALAASRNLPAIRLLRDVGPERFADVLARLGLELPPHALHVDAALGTMSVSPLGLGRAYQRFAAPEPPAGVSIRARDHVLEALAGAAPGTRAGSPGRVAWKTGTSSGRRDAWCVGVSDTRVIVVWFGRLDGRPAPELVGGRVAADLLAALSAAL